MNTMLTQRLSQHGVITDLTTVGPDDIATVASRAEEAKQQSQYAVVYARAVKSILKSLVKTTKTQAGLYESAHDSLKQVDQYKLDMLKTELAHQTHMVRMQAKSQGEQQVAAAKQASAVEIEQVKTHNRLLKVGFAHQRALKASGPKRRGLFKLWN